MTTCARSTDRKRDAETEGEIERSQLQAAGAAVLISEF